MKSRTQPLRVLLALGIGIGLLILLTLLLLFTDNLLSVLQRLESHPLWLQSLFIGVLLLIGVFGGWLVWRLLIPTTRSSGQESADARRTAPSEGELTERIEMANEQGIPVGEAIAELGRLRERREAGTVHIALFGEISTGKSSLVAALLPGAEVTTGVSGGTTREIRHYSWHSPAGDELLLTDLPGLNEAGSQLDALARAEALRSHLVIYLVDSDLTRDQYQALRELLALGKPLLLALNKVDRYRDEELAALRNRLHERLADAGRVELVTLSSGGEEEVLRVHPDGREELVTRPRPPRIDELARAIQRHIDADPTALEQLRDSAVFLLIEQHLDAAEQRHRRSTGERIVTSYTRKAMVGAMAAVSPGTDLLVQGYLGYRMVSDLCDLHGVTLRKMDGDRLIGQVRAHVGKSLPLLLAVAGNGFKAFPGIGTLTGGLLHAVAYGLIFDSLGKAVARTLEGRGELATAPAAQLFKETLGEDLETRARALARLALERRDDS